MEDDIRWLLAGLIFCAVAGWAIRRLLARRAAARRERLLADAATTTRIEAAERFELEQEAEAASIRDAAQRQRAAERDLEAAQQRLEAEHRAQQARIAADAEAEALRLAGEARARLEAAQAAAAAATRAAEAATRRIEAERLAAQVAAREAAERREAARREAERIERERLEQERLAEAARLEAQAEQARLEAERLAASIQPPVSTPPTAPEDTLVLVADDSKIVRVKTGRLLAQHRYRVAFAVDGADAERQILEERPHVLITDVEMPELDGFQLTERLRARAETADIPVIMITAADDKHREQALRAGVDVLLGKPYPEEQLVDHIRRVMQLDPLQRRAEV